jgi:hypothetical protein
MNQKLEVWEKEEVTVVRERTIKRLTFRHLLNEFLNVFNLERGMIFTIKGMSVHPGATIKSYLDTGRDLVASPGRYFLVLVGLSLFVASLTGYFDVDSEFWTNFDEGMRNYDNSQELNPEIQKVNDTFKSLYLEYYIPYQNIWSIVSIIFTTIFSYLFFKDAGFNFVENFVINTYTFTHSFLVFLVMAIFKLNDPVSTSVYLLLYFMYSIWVYKQVFGFNWLNTSLRGILVSLLSTFFYIVVLGVLMLVLTVIRLKS